MIREKKFTMEEVESMIKPLSEKFEEFKQEYLALDKNVLMDAEKTQEIMEAFIAKLSDYEREQILHLPSNDGLLVLNEKERSIVVNCLFTLGTYVTFTDRQKELLNTLKAYLNVSEYKKINFETLLAIKDEQKQLEILKLILEVGYIANHDFAFLKDHGSYDALIKCIRYNQYDLQECKENIKEIYTTLGDSFAIQRFYVNNMKEKIQITDEEVAQIEETIEHLKETVKKKLPDIVEQKSDFIIEDTKRLQSIAYDFHRPLFGSILGCIQTDKLQDTYTMLFTTDRLFYKARNKMAVLPFSREKFECIKYENVETLQYKSDTKNSHDKILTIKYKDEEAEEKILEVQHSFLNESELSELLSNLKKIRNKIPKKNLDMFEGLSILSEDDKKDYMKIYVAFLKKAQLQPAYIGLLYEQFDTVDNLDTLLDQYCHGKEDVYDLLRNYHPACGKEVKELILLYLLDLCYCASYFEDMVYKQDHMDIIKEIAEISEIPKEKVELANMYSTMFIRLMSNDWDKKDLKSFASDLKEQYLLPEDIIKPVIAQIPDFVEKGSDNKGLVRKDFAKKMNTFKKQLPTRAHWTSSNAYDDYIDNIKRQIGKILYQSNIRFDALHEEKKLSYKISRTLLKHHKNK